MKKYFIDQALILSIGICCFGYLCYLGSHPFVTILKILIAFIWLFLCRRLLLIPLDLLFGAKKKIVYFSTAIISYKCEFCKKSYCYEWKFHYDKKGKLKLLIPKVLKEQDVLDLEPPPKNTPIEITYFKFSKILYKYKISSNQDRTADSSKPLKK